MAASANAPGGFSAVPLFPLPNVVLFPRAVLPLHIFEERYKQMTADVLRRDGQIAMALLRPGWEKNYYGQPAIDPIVCAGIILTHEQLPDGRFNFLLQGTARARVVREFDGHPYRVAELAALEETAPMEVDLLGYRRRFVEFFTETPLAASGIGRQFRQLLAGPTPTAGLGDLIAFNFLDDLSLRQSLLAETDVERRVARTVRALGALIDQMPPPASNHPSVN
jgi:ATP-dependent Lon protease